MKTGWRRELRRMGFICDGKSFSDMDPVMKYNVQSACAFQVKISLSYIVIQLIGPWDMLL